MLELIALYFIYKEAGKLALEKGYRPITWRIQAISAWFLGELTGMLIVLTYFPNQMITFLIIGICMAYLAYLILKQYWASLPYNPEEYE